MYPQNRSAERESQYERSEFRLALVVCDLVSACEEVLGCIERIGEHMANIERVRVGLSGFPGGPGVCTFYAVSGASALEPLHIMFTEFVASMPNDVTVQVENEGDVLNDVNGALVGSWSGTPQTSLVGAIGTGYPGGAGFQLSWLTNTILDGHRIKGRSYIVPMASGIFAPDGTLNPGNVAAYVAKGQEYVEAVSGNALVWHRPRKAKAADGSRHAITARDGASAEIVSAAVPDRSALLRSRR